MAADFKQVLKAYLTGAADLRDLADAYASDRTAGHPAAPMLALIERGVQAGRLPAALPELLHRHAATGDAPPPDEHTRLPPPPPSPVVGSAPAGDADSRTFVRLPDAVAPPPRTGTGRGSAAPDGTADSGPAPGSFGSASLASGASRSSRPGTGASYGGPRRANDRPLEVGEVLKDRFMLDRRLGDGGMGTVFKARDLRREEAGDTDPYVAIKVLTPEFSRHPDAVRTLQRETRKVQGLASDHIVRVHDFDQDFSADPPISFMTMEYLEGESLDQYIRHAVPHEGLSWKEARSIVAPLAEGLAYAHRRGLVHSDFKPANVLRTPQGTVKVLDFGIARIVDPEQKQRETFDVGTLGARTPAYASPEMFPSEAHPHGAGPDPRDDVYALACVIYEVLTGRHPFARKPANAARDAKLAPAAPSMLSKRQWQVLASGLAFEREARCGGCAQLLAGLDGDARRRRRLLTIGGSAGAGVLVLALAAAGPVRDWLTGRRIDALRSALGAGGEPAEAAIRTLATLSDATRRQALTAPGVQDGIVRRYLADADARVDENNGRHDFDGALALIGQARAWYPRDADLVQRRHALESRRDTLLGALNEAFVRALDEQRLGPTAGDDGVRALLARIAQIDPAHPALHDPRIGPAYATAVEAALARDDPDAGRALLVEGSRLVPGDPALADLDDQLRLAASHARHAQQLDALLAALDDFHPATLADFRAQRDALLHLRQLAPAHPRSTALEQALRERLDAALAESEQQHDWSAGRMLLDEFAPLLAADWRSARTERYVQAGEAARTRLTALEDDIRQQAAVGRIDDARAGLAQFVAQGADAAAQAGARTLIGRACLDAARQARTVGRYDAARVLLAQARELDPEPALADALAGEAEQIAQAEAAARPQLTGPERRRLAAEHAQALAAARRRFEAAFAAIDGAQQAPAALAALDGYARLSPDDPLASGGRARIAARLAELSAAQAQAGALDAAAGLLRQSLHLLPESVQLAEALDDIEHRRLATRRAAQAQRTQALYAGLDRQLAQPFSGSDWSRGLAAGLHELAARVPDDAPELARRRETVRRLYADAIEAALAGQHIAGARDKLAELGRLLPGTDPAALQARIDVADTAFRAGQQQRRAQAHIDGRKSDFAAQLRATDPDAAYQTLQALAKRLPADDPFLMQDAPRQLADGYLGLAAREAGQRRYDRALAVLDRARDVLPDAFGAGIGARHDEYRRDGTFAQLRDVLDQGTPEAVAGLDRRLHEVQQQFPDDYARQVADWPVALAARITQTAGRDAAGALALLDAARRLFPAAGELAAIHIELPAPAAPSYAARVSELVAAGQLSEADRVLAQGRRSEGEQPDFQQAADALELRRSKAEAAHTVAEHAQRRNDADGHRRALDDALALWADHADWRRELDALTAPPPAIATPATAKPRPPGGPTP